MPSNLAVIGFILSLVGAILDFSSGTLIFQGPSSMSMGGEMSMQPMISAGVAWPILLYSLGAILLATGLLGLTKIGKERMRLFGGLMVLYGIVMLVIGGAMIAGVTLMMSGIISGVAMLFIGAAMIGNGSLMVKRN
ncbi:MAG: hypothetical protein ACE5KG_07400 [Nitrososphaerales archaeon]